jgi:hypothetical protein
MSVPAWQRVSTLTFQTPSTQFAHVCILMMKKEHRSTTKIKIKNKIYEAKEGKKEKGRKGKEGK